jgi:hypothetical protein
MKDTMVINLQAERDRLADEAFHEYAALAQRAQSTLDISDALAAGRAWGRFLTHFRPEHPTPSDVSNLSEVRSERARA